MINRILHEWLSHTCIKFKWDGLTEWLASRTTDQGVPGSRPGRGTVHRYHTVFLPSDVFRLILSQMRKNKKTEDRDGQFVY